MKNGRPKKMSGHVKDLTGQKFDYLKVIRFEKTKGKTIKSSYWLCECQCGKSIIRSLKYLKWKKRQSCGCHFKDDIRKHFESKFEKTEKCWVWNGKTNAGGYGKWRACAASR